jgi:hypothetical protein
MLPALRAVVIDSYNQYPSIMEKVYNVERTSNSIEQIDEVTGLGAFVQTAEGENAYRDEIYPVFSKNFVPLQYTNSFDVTEIAREDDKWNIPKRAAATLGRGAFETKEIKMTNIVQNGFATTTVPSGQYLFSVSHPLAGGGTFANRLATHVDLDYNNYNTLRVAMMKTVNHRGMLVNILPQYLLVPPDGELMGNSIVGSPERPDTAERSVNPLYNKVQVLVSPYITDDDSFYIVGKPSDTGLMAFERVPLSVNNFIKEESGTAVTRARFRWVCDVWHPYAIFGSAGI